MNEIDFLEQLVSIRSPSGEEEAVGEFLVEQMTGLGFQAHLDKVGNAVGVMGDLEARRRVVLLGHMDTVTGKVPVRRHKNLLYGRGTVDAKGPLATFILATARAAPKLQDTRGGCGWTISGSSPIATAPGNRRVRPRRRSPSGIN